jgi:hypothetical protein
MNDIVGYVLVIVLYGLAIGLFEALGGLRAAAEALRQWGEASSTIQHTRNSTRSDRRLPEIHASERRRRWGPIPRARRARRLPIGNERE